MGDGNVKCWGKSIYGQLGQGDISNLGDHPDELGDKLPAINLGMGKTAVAIAAGYAHTCALLNDGSVKCWGYNANGELGQGDTSWRGDNSNELGDKLPAISLGTGKTAVAIVAGVGHTCALLNDGSVNCWGYNGYGELGQGDIASRGDNPDELGDKLPAISLGTGKTAVTIAAGSYHTCAVLNDGGVKCWGYNVNGELGQGDTSWRGDNPNELGDTLPAISLGTGKAAVAIAAGANYTCTLLNDGSVKCWGFNGGGELGQGDTESRGDTPGELGDTLPAVSLGTGKAAVAIVAGWYHACALLNDGSVKCWGSNANGELGQGDTATRGDNPDELGDNLPAVELGAGKTAVAITAGEHHTCALLNDGSVKCWGFNNTGQLGQGDTATRGDNPNEMGEALPKVPL